MERSHAFLSFFSQLSTRSCIQDAKMINPLPLPLRSMVKIDLQLTVSSSQLLHIPSSTHIPVCLVQLHPKGNTQKHLFS